MEAVPAQQYGANLLSMNMLFETNHALVNVLDLISHLGQFARVYQWKVLVDLVLVKFFFFSLCLSKPKMIWSRTHSELSVVLCLVSR